jgi:trehalose 6-phosphate synthase
MSPERRSPTADQIIVVSNREPYRHERGPDGVLRVTRASSGVVNAVEPLLLDARGVWIAEGSGNADRETALNADGLEVPPDQPRYRLRRIWLTPAERQGYYYGFANSGLWPLCHRTSVEPTFFAADFGAYEIVNRRFAEAVGEEALVASPIVFVQDYHLALAPAFIRRELPLARIATFWHIPWPAPDVFRRCPWSQALLTGLLGSSVLGFQTPLDRENFVRCAERIAEVDLDDYTVVTGGRRTRLGVYPASIDWPGEFAGGLPPVPVCREEVRRELHLPAYTLLGLGVDRLDYTKGIEEKFLAVERLLENRHDLRGRFVFVQIAEPSREPLPAYRQTRERALAAAERINNRFGGGQPPIRLLAAHYDQAVIGRYMRAADLCYVGSLHDGMNLVCKEFVAARDDEQGVLVLSAFAGASHELSDALIVNPYDLEQVARTLAAALEMPLPQQQSRMRRMRRIIANADAQAWARRILSDVAREAADLHDARRTAHAVNRLSPLSLS